MAADELVFFIVDEVVNAGVATVTLDQGSDKLSDKYMTGNEFGKWIRKKTGLYVHARIDTHTHTLWKNHLFCLNEISFRRDYKSCRIGVVV